MKRRLFAWLMVIAMLVMSLPAYADEEPVVAVLINEVSGTSINPMGYVPGETVKLQLSIDSGDAYTVEYEWSVNGQDNWTLIEKHEAVTGADSLDFVIPATGGQWKIGTLVDFRAKINNGEDNNDIVALLSIVIVDPSIIYVQKNSDIGKEYAFEGNDYPGNGYFLGDYQKYGIVTNHYHQTAHAQTNFAAGIYEHDDQKENGADLTNNPGEILIGVVKGTPLKLNSGAAGTKITVDPDAQEWIRDQLLWIEQQSLSVIENETVQLPMPLSLDTGSEQFANSNDKYVIDVTKFTDEGTIFIQFDEIKEALGNTEFVIKMNGNQTIVFNMKSDKVTIYKYSVEVDGTMIGGDPWGSNDPGELNSKTEAEIKAWEYASSHVIWNLPYASYVTNAGSFHGTVIAPNGHFEVGSTAEGWIAADKVSNPKGEWHSPNRHVPDNGLKVGSLKLTKKYNGKADGEVTIRARLLNTSFMGKFGEQDGFQFDEYGYAEYKMLNDGDWAGITNVPVGTVIEFTEIGSSGYDVSWNITGGTWEKVDGNTIRVTITEENPVISIEWTNTRSEEQGGFEVTKAVHGAVNGPFEFTVELAMACIDWSNTTGPAIETPNGSLNTEWNGNGYAATIILKAGESFSVKNLPVGTPYTITETDSKGAVVTWSDNVQANGTVAKGVVGADENTEITVTNTESTQITVNKEWADELTNHGAVKVQLKANGENYGKSVVLNKANSWTYTWTDLPAVDEKGNPIEYTVEEVDVPNGYKATVTGTDGVFTITNTLGDEGGKPKPGTGEIEGTKTLDGDAPADGLFTFKIVPNKGNDDGDPVPAAGATVQNKGGSFKFSFKYEQEGNYSYTVTEVAENTDVYNYDDAQYTVEVSVKDNGGETLDVTVTVTGGPIVFKNTTKTTGEGPKPGTGEIEGTKTLDGDAPADGLFTFKIVPNKGNDDGDPVPAAGATVQNKGGSFKFSFKYEQEGNYSYTVTEVAENTDVYNYDDAQYTVEVSVKDNGGETLDVTVTVTGGPIVFKNTTKTIEPETGDLIVTKTVTGTDADLSKQFTFTVTLYNADGEVATDISDTYDEMTFVEGVATFTLAHGESKTATGLPAGITYEVTENNEDYSWKADDCKGTIPADGSITAAFVNTKDKVEEEQPTPTAAPTATPGNNGGGNPTPNPTATPDNSVPTDTPAPTEVPTPAPTATPIPTTDVKGQKSWQDNDNAGNTRPASIVVRLLRNGVQIDQMTVTAANGWSYSFNNLPAVDENGAAYTYSVSEQMVSGYYAVYNGYNITNVLTRTIDPGDDTTPDGSRFQRMRTPDGDYVRIRSYGTPLGIRAGGEPTVEELSDLITLFGYGTPLWGGLLQTGDTLPMYPFIFGGCGFVAIALLLVLEQKKRKQRS